jgi:hypothetical protein
MSDLHKLVISAPDGAGYNATVTLDGQPVRCQSITLRCDAQEVTSAVIEFNAVAVEFDGLADVVGKIVPDEAPA